MRVVWMSEQRLLRTPSNRVTVIRSISNPKPQLRFLLTQILNKARALSREFYSTRYRVTEI